MLLQFLDVKGLHIFCCYLHVTEFDTSLIMCLYFVSATYLYEGKKLEIFCEHVAYLHSIL